MPQKYGKPIPLYRQLSQELIFYIQKNLKTGDLLLSEREIGERYAVSRTTVRQALAELESQGYIYKRHGKGSFVSSLYMEKAISSKFPNYAEQIHNTGNCPETQLLSFKKMIANPFLWEIMNLSEGEVYRMEYLHFSGKEPHVYEIIYVPVPLFSNLSVSLLESRNLYELIEEVYDYPIAYIDQEISSSSLSATESGFLGETPSAPCLKITRSTYLDTQQIVEYAVSVAKTEDFIYKTRQNYYT